MGPLRSGPTAPDTTDLRTALRAANATLDRGCLLPGRSTDAWRAVREVTDEIVAAAWWLAETDPGGAVHCLELARRTVTAAATGAEDLSTVLAEVEHLADVADIDPGLDGVAMAGIGRIRAAARRSMARAVVYLAPPPACGGSGRAARCRVLVAVVSATGEVNVWTPATHGDVHDLPLDELARPWPARPDPTALRRIITWAGPVMTTVIARLGCDEPAPPGPAEARRATRRSQRHLVLVPHGPLSLVPWHAALVGTAPARYACESLTPSYSCSARQLGRARQPSGIGPGPGGMVTVVADPAGQPRPWAGLSASSITRHPFPRARLWGRVPGTERSRVTPQDVLDLIRDGACVLDLTGHARSDMEPDRAGLALAGGWLSVSAVLSRPAASTPTAGLLVLPGCSSAIPVADHDQALTLPEAMLGSAAHAVVATHWHVDDAWAATMSQVFHGFLAARMPSGAAGGSWPDSAGALAAAQRWFLSPGRQRPAWMVELFDAVLTQLDDPTSGDALACWAAFTHHGTGQRLEAEPADHLTGTDLGSGTDFSPRFGQRPQYCQRSP